jgi:hypothetical protein
MVMARQKEVAAIRWLRAAGAVGDHLLGKLVPKIEARAACCGSCCCISYRCVWFNNRWNYQCLYTCYAESFEGCFVYSQYWKTLIAGNCPS